MQISFVEGLEELLPLVRVDEYLIINDLLNNNELDLNRIVGFNSKININTLNNALYLLKNDNLITSDNKLNTDKLNAEFKDYLLDTLNYGLTRYEIEFGDYEGVFKLYGNYYKEQIALAMNREYTMDFRITGILYPNEQGESYFFVGLKKDKAKEEKNNYHDKFISEDIFMWESQNDTKIDNARGQKLLKTKKVHLFIRKMDEEDGITLPFTYFGTGELTNLRTSKIKYATKELDTLLFDIKLDNPVPKEYHFDFEIPEGD